MDNTQYKSWEIAGRKIVFTLFNPLIYLIIKFDIRPNVLTLIGLLLNIASMVVLVYGTGHADRFQLQYISYSGLLILLGGLFDMLDGLIAKSQGKSTSFGALFDSVTDRYSELFMFLGILYFLVGHQYFFSSVFTFLALIGSVMVSYIRARAEGLGIPCSIGLMQRPVRILLIGFPALITGIASSIIGPYNLIRIFDGIYIVDTITILIIPIIIIAILSNYTAIERISYVYNYLKNAGELKL